MNVISCIVHLASVLVGVVSCIVHLASGLVDVVSGIVTSDRAQRLRKSHGSGGFNKDVGN